MTQPHERDGALPDRAGGGTQGSAPQRPGVLLGDTGRLEVSPHSPLPSPMGSVLVSEGARKAREAVARGSWHFVECTLATSHQE